MNFIIKCGSRYAAILSLTLSLFSTVHAQTVVTTTDDEDDGVVDSGTGAGTSLREAVLYSAANSTITFNNSLSGQIIVLTLGQIAVANNLTIDGSTLVDAIVIDGNANGRIFNFSGGITCVMDSLTLTNGLASSSSGGAILLNNTGNLTIRNSTLSGNSSASSLGGAIMNQGGILTVENSTFSENSANYGGGIFSTTDLALLKTTIINSTFFNNSATSYGGAICNFDGRTELIHSTFTGNTAPSGTGSGVASYGDTGTETIVDHCIISGNTNSDVNYILDVSNSFTSSGYNLIGTGNAQGDFNVTGDSTGVTDPELAALGNYGGPTQTMKPMPGSAAIDAGDSTSAFSADQRGFTRVFNGNADKGAVEVQPPLSRLVFYNDSAWDGDAGASANDDLAIATDKSELLPGEEAAIANYTSYSKGLNGIMVDIAGLLGTPTASDFEFAVGNDNDPANWSAAPAPSSVTIRPGAGVGGSDRVTLIWANNNLDATVNANEAVAKQWLEVTVRATANTGLVEDDVFYYGNAVGESGNTTANARVDLTDELGARFNGHNFLNPAPVDDEYDYNRDKRVDLTDELIARFNTTSFLTDLKLIDLSGGGALAAQLSVTDFPKENNTNTSLSMVSTAPGNYILRTSATRGRLEFAESVNGPWYPVEVVHEVNAQSYQWSIQIDSKKPKLFYRLNSDFEQFSGNQELK